MKKLFVLIVALGMVGFTVPAVAAEWSFYGSARMATFWTDVDGGDIKGDDEGLEWGQQGNARIGARVKGETVGGRFEYGEGPNLRMLYGTWNFGSGRILLGQTYTPVNMFYSNQVFGADNGLLDVGGVYGGRHAMINLQMAGFEIALVEPQTASPVGTDGDGDTTTPKIEAAYGFSTDQFNVKVVGGYQTYEVEDSTDAGTYDVDAWVVAGGGGVDFGPAYVRGNIFVAQNYSNYGLVNWNLPAGSNAGFAQIVAGDIEDSDDFGFIAVVGFKASDMLSFEGGYGWVSHELDVSGSNEDETTEYYVQAVITIAPGFFIVPEVGFFDYDENGAGVDEGDMTYFGAKWQMNF